MLRPADATAEPPTGGSRRAPGVSGAPGATGGGGASENPLSIAALERETGVAKDTLRVWERRYGFPQPGRDAFGERIYPAEQVQRLRLIKRLLDAGQRPGRVVPLQPAALEALAAEARARAAVPRGPSGPDPLATWQAELDLIRGHDAPLLRAELSRSLARLGLARFVTELVAPLTTAVGEAWLSGQLAIHEEHLYSEAVQAVMRQALGALPDTGSAARPRVLLTTFPGEPHGLGLLMAEAMLALEACRCTSLGVMTPLAEIAGAATAQRVDIVALSFTGCTVAGQVLSGLSTLRGLLQPDMQLWAGGRAPVLQRRPPAHVQVIDSLQDIAQAVRLWRAAHPDAGAA